jgi:imidazoleglycerol phosphate dehydratase HisB
MEKRTAKIHRKTKETDVNISLNLDDADKFNLHINVPD